MPKKGPSAKTGQKTGINNFGSSKNSKQSNNNSKKDSQILNLNKKNRSNAKTKNSISQKGSKNGASSVIKTEQQYWYSPVLNALHGLGFTSISRYTEQDKLTRKFECLLDNDNAFSIIHHIEDKYYQLIDKDKKQEIGKFENLQDVIKRIKDYLLDMYKKKINRVVSIVRGIMPSSGHRLDDNQSWTYYDCGEQRKLLTWRQPAPIIGLCFTGNGIQVNVYRGKERKHDFCNTNMDESIKSVLKWLIDTLNEQTQEKSKAAHQKEIDSLKRELCYKTNDACNLLEKLDKKIENISTMFTDTPSGNKKSWCFTLKMKIDGEEVELKIEEQNGKLKGELFEKLFEKNVIKLSIEDQQVSALGHIFNFLIEPILQQEKDNNNQTLDNASEINSIPPTNKINNNNSVCENKENDIISSNNNSNSMKSIKQNLQQYEHENEKTTNKKQEELIQKQKATEKIKIIRTSLKEMEEKYNFKHKLRSYLKCLINCESLKEFITKSDLPKQKTLSNPPSANDVYFNRAFAFFDELKNCYKQKNVKNLDIENLENLFFQLFVYSGNTVNNEASNNNDLAILDLPKMSELLTLVYGQGNQKIIYEPFSSVETVSLLNLSVTEYPTKIIDKMPTNQQSYVKLINKDKKEVGSFLLKCYLLKEGRFKDGRFLNLDIDGKQIEEIGIYDFFDIVKDKKDYSLSIEPINKEKVEKLPVNDLEQTNYNYLDSNTIGGSKGKLILEKMSPLTGVDDKECAVKVPKGNPLETIHVDSLKDFIENGDTSPFSYQKNFDGRQLVDFLMTANNKLGSENQEDAYLNRGSRFSRMFYPNRRRANFVYETVEKIINNDKNKTQFRIRENITDEKDKEAFKQRLQAKFINNQRNLQSLKETLSMVTCSCCP